MTGELSPPLKLMIWRESVGQPPTAFLFVTSVAAPVPVVPWNCVAKVRVVNSYMKVGLNNGHFGKEYPAALTRLFFKKST